MEGVEVYHCFFEFRNKCENYLYTKGVQIYSVSGRVRPLKMGKYSGWTILEQFSAGSERGVLCQKT